MESIRKRNPERTIARFTTSVTSSTTSPGRSTSGSRQPAPAPSSTWASTSSSKRRCWKESPACSITPQPSAGAGHPRADPAPRAHPGARVPLDPGGAGGSNIAHIAYVVDDRAAESKRLEAAGMPGVPAFAPGADPDLVARLAVVRACDRGARRTPTRSTNCSRCSRPGLKDGMERAAVGLRCLESSVLGVSRDVASPRRFSCRQSATAPRVRPRADRVSSSMSDSTRSNETPSSTSSVTVSR